MKRPACVVLLCLVAVAPRVTAQQLSAPIDSALHRIFASGTYASERFGPARWAGGGDSYLTLEPAGGGNGYDLVEYDAATGARRVKVPAAELIPAGRGAPLIPQDYAFSADGRQLLVFTNTRRVWRQNTRGDYWVLNLATKRLHQVGGAGVPESRLMFAKFSPDGSRVAYVLNGDLYVEPSAGGAATRLTHDASHTLVNGMSDWVYEEEFGLRDGFRWSPDGANIAFWQFDMTGIRDFLMLDVTDSLYPYTVPVQYPKAGTTNSAVRVGVVPATGGPVTWIALPGAPRDNYVPWMEWAGDREVMIQHMNRAQNHDAVILADVRTGAPRTVFTETDSAWVDLVDDVHWMPGQPGVPVAERARRMAAHLRGVARRAHAAAAHARRLRRGERGGHRRRGRLAVRDRLARQRHAAVSVPRVARPIRARRSGCRRPARPGVHGYDFSPNAHWAFHTYSSFDTPPVMDLVRFPDGVTGAHAADERAAPCRGRRRRSARRCSSST